MASATPSLHASLRLPSADFKQATIWRGLGLTSPQACLTSSAQDCATAASFASLAWHGSENSLMCSLTQARIRPSPGLTSPHFDLISTAQARADDFSFAMALDDNNAKAMPPTRIAFSMGLPSTP